MPALLEQEMCLIFDRKDVKTSLIREWEKFIPAIIAYGQHSSKKSIVDIFVFT